VSWVWLAFAFRVAAMCLLWEGEGLSLTISLFTIRHLFDVGTGIEKLHTAAVIGHVAL
jgi:hypothetical protein